MLQQHCVCWLKAGINRVQFDSECLMVYSLWLLWQGNKRYVKPFFIDLFLWNVFRSTSSGHSVPVSINCFVDIHFVIWFNTVCSQLLLSTETIYFCWKLASFKAHSNKSESSCLCLHPMEGSLKSGNELKLKLQTQNWAGLITELYTMCCLFVWILLDAHNVVVGLVLFWGTET